MEMDIAIRREEEERMDIVIRRTIMTRRVPPHRSAALERTVHVEVEGTVGERRPVSSVLLESSRQ